MAVLQCILEKDCCLTQFGMAELLPPGMGNSQSTVNRVLKKAEWSRKLVKKVPVKRNTFPLMQERRQFAISIGCYADEDLWYLDETGFSTHTSERYGYAPKGMSPAITIPSSKGANVTLIAVITTKGLPMWKVLVGGLKAPVLSEFLRTLVIPYMGRTSSKVLCLDNCPVHHSEMVKEIADSRGLQLRYLPAYSPQLNPIEEVFAEIKRRFKSIRPRPKTTAEVEMAVDKIVQTMGAVDLSPYYSHMRMFLEQSFNMIPFPDWPIGEA